MSEEILRALMQLFAIIARQDNKLLEGHENFVLDFLSSQLSLDRTNAYLRIYNEFLGEAKSDSGTEKDSSRISMKDSVRTLSICRKINKTLAQKQKTIVLIRLLEFIKKEPQLSKNRMHIVETVADVFNADKTEFQETIAFVFEKKDEASPGEIIIGEDGVNIACRHYIPIHNYHGLCKFLFLKSINVIILKYHGEQELFLNGAVIKSEDIYIFPHGGTVRLPQTTIYFSAIISKFLEEHQGEAFSFTAEIKEHKFPNGWKALHEINIHESSGHLVAIMGASGSGKTTLMTLLSGQEKPSSGTVKINNINLHAAGNSLKGVIGYVPQDDLLIEDLSVYQNLYYNARLCFRDLNEKEINLKISRTLLSLGLEEIKNIKVGNALNKKISGGQRKRLNIALELIREPQVLFLDEPTSGLSSRDSENVLDLLKELTLRGKLVFIVIHQPSSDIFKMFDKILFLDTGGYPVYYGNPIESVMYFKKVTHQINADTSECHTCGNVNPELIFNLIELKEIDEYGNYTTERRIKPDEFYDFFKTKEVNTKAPREIDKGIESNLNIPGKFIQTKYFFLRDFYAKISNKQYLLINLLEVPALALILSLMIRFTDKSKDKDYTFLHNYNIPAYFFMAIIVALLVGLTISAEEIYKDQKILKREKFLHLSRLSYLSSKVILLFSISIIQTILFLIIGNSILGIRDNAWHMFLMLFSVFAFANLLGLVLSSTFNSPVTIYIIIPLVIIPQLLLGGAMFSYDKLNTLFGGGHKVPPPANFMVSRWAYEALAVDMFVNGTYEREKYQYDKLESKLNYKLTYLYPKIEELVPSADSLKKEKTFQFISQILKEDHKDAAGFGYTKELPPLNDYKAFKSYLDETKEFYNKKFIAISELKDEFQQKIEKKAGGQKKLFELKEKYYNNRLEELVTAGMEKEKIATDDGRFIQVIDAVYLDPPKSAFSIGSHFFAPVKYLFGMRISTFSFNLIIIWLINALVFVLLYSDVFKISVKKIS